MLTREIERQSKLLISEARLLLGEALALDPDMENITPEQVIERIGRLRDRTAKLRTLSTCVRTNTKAYVRRRRTMEAYRG